MEACVLVLFPRASACVQADQSNGVSAPQRSLREKASACFAWSAFSRRRKLIVQFRPGSLWLRRRPGRRQDSLLAEKGLNRLVDLDALLGVAAVEAVFAAGNRHQLV